MRWKSICIIIHIILMHLSFTIKGMMYASIRDCLKISGERHIVHGRFHLQTQFYEKTEKVLDGYHGLPYLMEDRMKCKCILCITDHKL